MRRKPGPNPGKLSQAGILEDLRRRLADAEEALRAIRQGEIDALIVETREGQRVFTLEGAEHPYRVMVETMQEGAVTLTPDGSIVYSNARFSQMLGLPLSLLLPSSFLEFLPPEEHTRFLEFLRAEPPAESRQEYCLIAADGRRLPAVLSLGPLDVGDYVRCLVITDVSKLRAVEDANRALEESEKRFRATFEQAAVGVAHIDLQGKLIRVNQRLSQILNYPPERLCERTVGELIHPGDRAVSESLRARLISGEISSYSTEKRYIRSDDTEVWVNVTGSLVNDASGRPAYVIIVVEDIMERKAIEFELKNLSENLEKLVRERTELAEKRAALLREKTLELTYVEQRERQKIAQVLHDNVQQLLVGAKFSLVAFKSKAKVKSEAGQHLDDIADLLDQTIGVARSLSYDLSPPILHQAGLIPALEWVARDFEKKQGLKVELRLGVDREDLPVPVRLFLFQAVRELLFNVAKHAGVGTARVTLSPSDGSLEIRVEDEGAGFDVKQVRGVRFGDSGFGLFSIEERVALLGGSVDIDSTPGKGSRFCIRFPIAPGTEAVGSDEVGSGVQKPAETVTRPTAASTSSKPLRLLLVDDHRIVLHGLALLLKQEADFEVIGEAENGREAIEMVRRKKPDVVLMDILMPEIDGVEATRIIKKEFPHICVIGLSMFEHGEMCRRILEAGAALFLNKGGPPQQLIAALRAQKRGELPTS